MMQELLLALLGYDGPIFHLNQKQQFQTPEGVLSDHEESVLQRVLETAVQYKTLVNFSKSNRCGQGRYRAALAAAVTDATLPYRDCIVELERRVLERPHLPLTHIHTELHAHTPLLHALARLLQEVVDESVRGCQVLGAVHRHTITAVLHTKDVMHSLEQQVASVLYEQLTQWLLYGALLDPAREFFLQTEKDGSVSLAAALLPAHLPAALAHKTLFVGQAVKDFQGHQREAGQDRGGGGSSSAGKLLQADESRFLAQLTRLSQSRTFSLLDLAAVLEDIRATVSRHLCSVVTQGGLVGALDQLKGVLLLGRGELYHTLLDTAGYLLDGPVNTAANMSTMFHSCGQLVQVEENLLEQFTICCSQQAVDQLPQVVQQTKGHAGTGWSSLHVSYSGGPRVLQQLLQTTAVQLAYSRLFAFLLCVRRAQQRLHRAWVTHLKDTRRMQQERCVWTLRHQMTLLLDGLQYYLQVDVLESHHYRLVSSLAACSDYQQLQMLITSYLANLTTHCFINHKLVAKCVASLLSLCHQLCDALHDHGSGLDVTALSAAVNSSCRQLFLVLCSLQQLPGQQHTACLLSRLDYNMHYRELHQQRALSAQDGDHSADTAVG